MLPSLFRNAGGARFNGGKQEAVERTAAQDEETDGGSERSLERGQALRRGWRRAERRVTQGSGH
jgi:hypothetical protein